MNAARNAAVKSTIEVGRGDDKGNRRSIRKLIAYSLGIFISYFVFGVLQENITKRHYGEDGSGLFTYMAVIVFVQCIANTLFAKFAMVALKYERVVGATPHRLYSLLSFTYLGAMLSSNYALHYISYPAQVLGKSAKPIPVMILGVILARKRYRLVKYLFVVIITLGVTLFMYEDSERTSASSGPGSGTGETLLLLSLLFDGLTGGIQDRLLAEHCTFAYSMMYWINLWSTGYLALMLTVTGEGYEFVAFAWTYPYVIVQLIIFAVCGSIGQSFIFLTIYSFGPLTCSLVTTTRKFFSILSSVIIFQHNLSVQQWLGTVLVFCGLVLDSLYGQERRSLPTHSF